MQAGKLSERIVIEKRETGVDPIGQPIDQWVTFMECWADVRHLSGMETIKADATVSVTRGSIRIRNRKTRPRPTASMRVVYDGHLYEIRSVLPNHRQAYLDLIVETNGETA